LRGEVVCVICHGRASHLRMSSVGLSLCWAFTRLTEELRLGQQNPPDVRRPHGRNAGPSLRAESLLYMRLHHVGQNPDVDGSANQVGNDNCGKEMCKRAKNPEQADEHANGRKNESENAGPILKFPEAETNHGVEHGESKNKNTGQGTEPDVVTNP